MAKFLLTLKSSGSLAAARGLESPPQYMIEFQEGASSAPDAAHDDGLDRWNVELQIAGAVGDWANGSSYDAMWAYLESALMGYEVRPRCLLSIKSRAEPRRIGCSFKYLGDHEVSRARESLRQRIGAAIDPQSKKLKGDVDLAL